jgi:hypothetical protein
LAALVFIGAMAGPEAARAGSQNYTWKHEAIYGGGFVTGVFCNPNFQNVIYCETDTGGAYRWNNTNSTWEPLMDWFSGAMGVESIALDPTDANRVYLSVGEDNWAGHDSILVSTNQGNTFATNTLPFGIAANNDGRSNGPRMMVDPNLPSILFYAAHSGLYKSMNQGQTWSKVSSFPVSTTANGVGPNFVQFIQSSGSPGSATPVIYVGVSLTNSSSQNNLYYTSNGGTNWTAVSTSAAGATMMPHRAAQDGVGNMYITFCDAPGPNGISYGAVLKLNLSTLTTRVVTPPTGQGGFAGVSVSKQNTNQVAVSTMDRWWPHDVIYLSTNGGTNWTDTTSGATVNVSSAPWMAWHSTPGFGSWTGDCQIDPYNSNRLWYVTGSGVMGITNLVASSGRVYSPMSTGIEEMGAGNIASPPSGPLLYSFFWDIGGFAHYNLDVSPPDTNYFNPVGGSNVHGEYADAAPWIVARVAYSLNNYGAYSTDYGKTWTSFGSYPASVANNGPGTIAVSANGTYLMWTPWNDDQYYSANNGTTWTKSTGGTTEHYGYSAVADRVADNTFYIYDAAVSHFLRSINGGQSFSVVNSSLVQWGANPPATVFGRAGDVWLPTWNGLYHSINYGTNWTQLLPGQDVATVGFGKAASGASYPAVYISAQLTGTSCHDVYRSNDGGVTWTRINDDQHRWGIISQVRGDQRTYGTVYIGARDYGNIYGFPSNTPPVLAPIGNRTVNVGSNVVFTASVTDTDQPPQTLTFNLLAGAGNATLNTNSGAFAWRPAVTNANTTNAFTLKVADNGSPILSATQSFTVTVNPLTQPTAASIALNNGRFGFQISGQAGPDYAVQVSSNLSGWNTLFITNSPAMPFSWTDTNAATLPAQFYRIKAGPPLP